MLADLIANLVAAAHIGYFVFVVGGFVAIIVGALDVIYWSLGLLLPVLLFAVRPQFSRSHRFGSR
jgi:hypothetical protein